MKCVCHHTQGQTGNVAASQPSSSGKRARRTPQLLNVGTPGNRPWAFTAPVFLKVGRGEVRVLFRGEETRREKRAHEAAPPGASCRGKPLPGGAEAAGKTAHPAQGPLSRLPAERGTSARAAGLRSNRNLAAITLSSCSKGDLTVFQDIRAGVVARAQPSPGAANRYSPGLLPLQAHLHKTTLRMGW